MKQYELRKNFFQAEHLGKDLFYFPEIDSTQSFIKVKLQENAIKVGTIALADRQTSGKGTQGRTWFSLPKPQLMFSILLYPELPPQKLPIINILAAVLWLDVLKERQIHAQIKWPNDLYIDSRKAGGILSELVVQNNKAYLILGIGINIDGDITDFPIDLQNKVTALSQYQTVDRFEILGKFLIKLETYLHTKTPMELISYTRMRFRDSWMLKQQPIEIRQDKNSLYGIANEIDDNGALQLITDRGIEKIGSGTIMIPGQ